MLQFKGIIRAVARPNVGRPVVGARINGAPIRTSAAQKILGGENVAIVRTRHSWYIVLPIKPPAPQAVSRQRANGR